MSTRRRQALDVRRAAAEAAFDRPHDTHVANGEEVRYRFDADSGIARIAGHPSYIARFTKGLPHDQYGIVMDPRDADDFREAIESGSFVEFRRVRIGPRPIATVAADGGEDRDGEFGPNPPAVLPWNTTRLSGRGITGDPASVVEPTETTEGVEHVGGRKWESPTAGHAFDLEGPDAQAITIPPAPELQSEELIAEMCEVYAMALLRDLPFGEFDSSAAATQIQEGLDTLSWFSGANLPRLSAAEQRRRRGPFGRPSQLFRGIAEGDDQGPLVSQFLLVGNSVLGSGGLENGQIQYGAIRVDQRVRVALPASEGGDHMTHWAQWLDVQNGASFGGFDRFVDASEGAEFRFALTPRDLATYVHFDQLYEAYLNACLILFGIGAPLDRGLPLVDEPTQVGFATFGGPHLLALLTEVSSRALKAVRFQKFNVHARPRPEAVGGLLELFDQGFGSDGVDVMAGLHSAMTSTGLLARVRAHNQAHNDLIVGSGQYASAGPADPAVSPAWRHNSALLPMAFPEGSPMHPAYGAGHATVAGACTTILKAWFDCGHELDFAFEADPETDGATLRDAASETLTVGGELNKLAANISNGRNMAGVHYFTDYWESMLLGQKIAIDILEEQKLTYPESFRLSVPLFEGGVHEV